MLKYTYACLPLSPGLITTHIYTWVDFRVQYENEHVQHFVIIMVQYCRKTKKHILIKNPT